jgi:hypothetical protein
LDKANARTLSQRAYALQTRHAAVQAVCDNRNRADGALHAAAKRYADLIPWHFQVDMVQGLGAAPNVTVVDAPVEADDQLLWHFRNTANVFAICTSDGDAVVGGARVIRLMSNRVGVQLYDIPAAAGTPWRRSVLELTSLIAFSDFEHFRDIGIVTAYAVALSVAGNVPGEHDDVTAGTTLDALARALFSKKPNCKPRRVAEHVWADQSDGNKLVLVRRAIQHTYEQLHNAVVCNANGELRTLRTNDAVFATLPGTRARFGVAESNDAVARRPLHVRLAANQVDELKHVVAHFNCGACGESFATPFEFAAHTAVAPVNGAADSKE